MSGAPQSAQFEPQSTPQTANPVNSISPPPIMPTPKPNSLPLTLILAATPSLGIGRAGGLPWPPHRSDMQYFARVTKRVPAQLAMRGEKRVLNAVIMGRKTWESIPTKFRPLARRVNVVISRRGNVDGIDAVGEVQGKEKEPVLLAENLSAALKILSSEISPSSPATLPADLCIGRVFIIGGSTIYKSALELANTKSILLTKIGKEYECDTHFPLDPDGVDGRSKGWIRKEKKKLEKFVGEEVGEGGKEEKGVPFEFCLFEKDGNDEIPA